MKKTENATTPRYNVAFQGGESLHLRGCKAVDFMALYDPDKCGELLRDDDGNLLLYVEISTDDDPTDDYGNPLDDCRHYDELKAMLLKQAAERGIPGEALRFPLDD